MDAKEIKQALIDIHPSLTLTLIAKEKGIALNTLSSVINRRYTAKECALVICKVLNKTPEEVFPDVPQYATPVGTSEEAQAILKKRLSA